MTEREDALNNLIRLRNAFRGMITDINSRSYSLRNSEDAKSLRWLAEAVVNFTELPIAYLKKPEQKPMIIKESIYNRRMYD